MDRKQWKEAVKDTPDDFLARLSRLRPDLVSLVPESVWVKENRYGEPLVSKYLRWEGVAGVVPETVWPQYLSWVVGERGEQWQRADSLAQLSLERPDLVSQVPEAVWLRQDCAGIPLVNWYLHCGGVAGGVPESVWDGYVLWVVGDLDDRNKAERLAKLSRKRPDLVSRVPESVWLQQDYAGELLVSLYLRYGGVAGVVPVSVWAGYVSWVVGEGGELWQKAGSLARLSRDRPDVVLRVPRELLERCVSTEDYRNASGLSVEEMECLLAGGATLVVVLDRVSGPVRIRQTR